MLGFAMYYPQAPREPSGCMQTLIITRMMVGILAIPVGLILGAVGAVILALFALNIHPLLGLAVVLGAIGGLLLLARWESRRIRRQTPNDD
jgi:hypothetical protein